MLRLLGSAAVVMAACLLGLQILAALEYTDGGSLYTRLSMIAAMCSLAALPIFIHAAWQVRAYPLAVALFISFVCFLAYSLPATTGKSGEIRESKAAQAIDVAKMRDDLERTKKQAEWARQNWINECGTGDGPKCRGKRNTVEALDDRVAKLEGQLQTVAPTATGDLGSTIWADTLGFSDKQVRTAGIIGLAAGLDVAIWALVWLASVMFTQASARITERPEGEITDEEIEEVRRILAKNRKPLTNDELADLMSVSKAEASKRATKAAEAGVVTKERNGRNVSIRLN